MVRYIFTALSALCSLYSVVVFIRIVLTWFVGPSTGRAQSYLCRITDPYISLFRGARKFRLVTVDLSPLFAMLVLSLVGACFLEIARNGTVSVGFLLSLLLLMLNHLVTFLAGFYIVLMILRLFAYLLNLDISTPAWRFLDCLSRPMHYQITRIFFRNNVGHYLTGIILTIITLSLVLAGMRFIAYTGEAFLKNLPY